jgi:hypothetical protein
MYALFLYLTLATNLTAPIQLPSHFPTLAACESYAKAYLQEAVGPSMAPGGEFHWFCLPTQDPHALTLTP